MKRKQAYLYKYDLINLLNTLDELWEIKKQTEDISAVLSCLDEIIDTARNMKVQLQREK